MTTPYRGSFRVRVAGGVSKFDQKEVQIFHTQTADEIASLAFGFMTQWGMVAGIPDGEDSTGRSRIRLSTPEELVTRAFDIAERAYAVARERGLLLPLPDLNEINAEADAKYTATKEAQRA